MRKHLARTAASLVAGMILIAQPTLADHGPKSIAYPALAGQAPQLVPLPQLADDDRAGLQFIVPWFLRHFLATPYQTFFHRGDDGRRGWFGSDGSGWFGSDDSGWSDSDDSGWSGSDDGFFDD